MGIRRSSGTLRLDCCVDTVLRPTKCRGRPGAFASVHKV
jgi:hypothetical protein